MCIRSLTVIAALATVALPALATADALDDAIKARQGYYQVVSHNAGMLFGMAKGEVAYDAAAATAHAKNLEALAVMNTASMWPAGSDNLSKAGKTRALPVIWETYPAILDKQKAFETASAALVANAGTGPDGLRANIGALGASCKGCHDTYRAKEF